MISVGRRGCPRTALELGRLLLSLDPENDPMRALLHIDFYALKADEAAAIGVEDDCLRWLLQLPTAQLRCHSLPLFPNYAFSLALARKRLHNRLLEQSNERRLDEVMEQRAAAAAQRGGEGVVICLDQQQPRAHAELGEASRGMGGDATGGTAAAGGGFCC